MYRKTTIAVVSILIAVFLATSWSPIAAQSGNERPNPVGVWDLEGVAQSNTKWIATLVLTRAKNGEITGHIDWISDKGASGREYVTGSYDAPTRVLGLKGTRVKYADNVVRCTYKVELSPDGSRLENGRWFDNDPAIPGSWSAQRIALQ